MKFSIVTPAFNGIPYLPLCCRSIADQAPLYVVNEPALQVEHIVQDGGSKDGTIDFLRDYAVQQGSAGNYQFSFVSEADKGMYDAINKGWEKSTGDVLAWLNADEQYLPCTLERVMNIFEKYPEVDMVFGDMLVVDPQGELISFRKTQPPRWSYILANYLYTFSCTMFFRRRIFDEGIRVDTQYRDVADEVFVTQALRAGYRAFTDKRYFSAFTWTGENMSTGENAQREIRSLLAGAPRWIRAVKPLLTGLRLTEKVLNGCYFQKAPLEYSIYTQARPEKRALIRCEKPDWRWPGNAGIRSK